MSKLKDSFLIALHPPLNDFRPNDPTVIFDGYSDLQQEGIAQRMWPAGGRPNELRFFLEEVAHAANHFRDLRNDFEKYRQRKSNEKYLEKVGAALDLVSEAEAGRGYPDSELLEKLADRRERISIELSRVDPFATSDSYIGFARMFDLGDPDQSLPKSPEHMFIGKLLEIFGKWRSTAIEEIEVGNNASNVFLGFALECTAPFGRARFTEMSIRDAARAHQDKR